MPNTCLLLVLETSLHTKDDVFVLIGGTNDTLKENFSSIYLTLEDKLNEVNKDKPTLITTVLTKRYVKGEFDEVHKEVNLLNNTILESLT